MYSRHFFSCSWIVFIMILHKNGRIFLVCSKKQWGKARKWGVPGSGEIHVSPPFSHCKNLCSQLCLHLSIPVGQSGGTPQRSSQGPVWGWRGHAKEGLCPSPSLLPPPVFKLGQRSIGLLRAGTWNFLTWCPPGHVEVEMGAGNPCKSLIITWKRRNQLPRIREHWVLRGGNCSRDVNDLVFLLASPQTQVLFPAFDTWRSWCSKKMACPGAGLGFQLMSLACALCTAPPLGCVWVFAVPWTVARQTLLSRQEYKSGLSFPSPGDLPDPGLETISLALASGFFTTTPPGKHVTASLFRVVSVMYVCMHGAKDEGRILNVNDLTSGEVSFSTFSKNHFFTVWLHSL